MLQYLDNYTQVNGKTGMYRLSVPVCGEWREVVYDLNIESKINIAGNAKIKICVCHY